MAHKDFSFLPPPIQNLVVINSVGEVMWPLERAAEVVDALADCGRVIFGLDLRSDGDDRASARTPTEVAWATFEPQGLDQDIERSRVAAHEALARQGLAELPEFRWVHITWSKS